MPHRPRRSGEGSLKLMTTLGELTTRIRSIVNDRDTVNPSGLRYSDQDVIGALNQAYALIWAYRPDAVLDSLPNPRMCLTKVG